MAALSEEKLENMNKIMVFEAGKVQSNPDKFWTLDNLITQIDRYYPDNYRYLSEEQKRDVDKRHEALKAHFNPKLETRPVSPNM